MNSLWDPDAKSASLRKWADHLHKEAKRVFLQDKAHAHFVFSFGNSGPVSVTPVAPKTPQDQIHNAIMVAIRKTPAEAEDVAGQQPADRCTRENLIRVGRLIFAFFGFRSVFQPLEQRLFRLSLILLALMLPVFPAAATTGELVCASSEDQTTLLELFTSEGCSSCPPAEAWLSRLVANPKLWTEFVPVAFHVDYWDYLGWKDRFASAQFTQRQQTYVTEWRHPAMYTPCFVVNGREAGATGHARLLERPRIMPGPLRVESKGQNIWVVRFTPAAPATGPYQAHVALLDCGLRVKVARGENAGRELAHDFVARLWQTVSMQEAGGTATAEMTLAKTPIETGVRRGLAVWVTCGGELMQAAGGWLP